MKFDHCCHSWKNISATLWKNPLLPRPPSWKTSFRRPWQVRIWRWREPLLDKRPHVRVQWLVAQAVLSLPQPQIYYKPATRPPAPQQAQGRSPSRLCLFSGRTRGEGVACQVSCDQISSFETRASLAEVMVTFVSKLQTQAFSTPGGPRTFWVFVN